MVTDCVPGDWSDAEGTNHFLANCAGVDAHEGACEVTMSAGYAGGSVVCDTSDGVYDVVVAVATACSGSFTNDEATNHFTADCSGKTVHGEACVIVLSAGYGAGRVTCDTTSGEYDVEVARLAGVYYHLWAAQERWVVQCLRV